MFRAAVEEDTELGRRTRAYMEAGALVPDELTIGIVEERLSKPDCQQGFVLDGFPRNVPQAEALSAVLDSLGLQLETVLLLEIDAELAVGRITGRRVCRDCGATYHVEFDPPAQDELCDECGGELYQRDDDKEATVRERLRVYERQTSPLVKYYEAEGLLTAVPAAGSIDEVTERLLLILGTG
jgi:adenylate kinase